MVITDILKIEPTAPAVAVDDLQRLFQPLPYPEPAWVVRSKSSPSRGPCGHGQILTYFEFEPDTRPAASCSRPSAAVLTVWARSKIYSWIEVRNFLDATPRSTTVPALLRDGFVGVYGRDLRPSPAGVPDLQVHQSDAPVSSNGSCKSFPLSRAKRGVSRTPLCRSTTRGSGSRSRPLRRMSLMAP